MIAHCLFEQSGTFKNEFKKLGYEAYDYDIQNEFGETDYVIDLFAEIEGGYQGKPSIFDNISKDDLILAFFPCIRFENQIMLWFRGQSHSQRDWSMEKKMQFDMDLLDEVSQMYKLVNKLFILCMRKGLRLVMENPYSEEHFLRRYWCYLPAIMRATDLRGGAAMVIAGLMAEGTTEITHPEYIDRGYDDLIGKLKVLGACIERKEVCTENAATVVKSLS